MRYVLLLMLLLPACAGRTVVVEKPVEKVVEVEVVNEPQTLPEKLRAATPLLHDCAENCRKMSLEKNIKATATVCGTVELGYACMCIPSEDAPKKKDSNFLEVRK